MRGIKKKAVAEHLGVTRQTYAKYEESPWLMNVEQAYAVCEFINCPMTEIFFGENVNLANADES